MPPSPFGIAVYLGAQADFRPQWLVSDIENLVYASVAQAVYQRNPDPTAFYGLVGLSYGLDRLSPDDHTIECNAVFTEVTGISYDPDENQDAWSAVGSTCLFIQNLEAAANWSQETYGTVNQTTLIQGFEALGGLPARRCHRLVEFHQARRPRCGHAQGVQSRLRLLG